MSTDAVDTKTLDLFDPLQARRDLASRLRRERVVQKGDSIIPRPYGQVLRDAGMGATLEAEKAEWLKDATSALERYAVIAREFTCEEFRGYWLALGRPAPHSHHVWGALFAAAAKAGTIKHCGYRKATSAKTHAHPVGIWSRAR